ncbi:MAG: RdgB/HAM1 family non-canonical purine NTP pyrophosphatase [bacterium]|nr:RdgB/HAM1 family non-canonical purine NTP pyrophosphatase [bacterium]
MFNLLVASNNPHKIHEYQEMFSGYEVKVHSPKELGINVNPDENGETYEANSLIKAKALAEFTKMPVIADDSGLNVVALDNFPGIHSSRFADSCGGNKYANPKLIEKLRGFSDKSAFFTCVITLLNVEKNPVVFKGICPGKILDKPEGKGGFGYDPIFYSEEAKQCFGTAPEEIKNKYSHRAKAMEQLINYLKKKSLI